MAGPFPQGHIDYDRGVHIRTHHSTGVDVYMYVDTPGVYLSQHGTPVSEDMARQAGFPVDEQVKARELQRRLKAAHEAVYAEMNAGEAAQKVVEERDGFTIVDIGLGRHVIKSPDGDQLTDIPLPLEQAQAVLAQLVPDEKAPPEPVVSAAPASGSGNLR